MGKKILGFGGQILLVAVGTMAGIWLLEQIRKPRIAPPTSAPAQA